MTTGTFSRRKFLGSSLTFLSLPAWAHSVPINPDVIVVGAGSAGLAAAKTLIAAGKSVVVLEAATRIGGRALTESSTFDFPFDHGCSWISSGNLNPYAKFAKDLGFDLHDHSAAAEALYVGNRKATRKESRKYDRDWYATLGALEKAGKAGLDVAASTVIPKDREFVGVSQTWIGAMDWGVDFNDLSTMDNYKSAEAAPNYMFKQGHGTLVQRISEGLPVQLRTPATKITWGGNGVSVETPSGTISAKACIVTVSTGVLGAGSIKFSPALPHWKLEAIDNVPMGLLVKIALQFNQERFGLRRNSWLSYWIPEKMPAEACYFLTWPFDFNIMIGFIGGEFGWEMSADGEAAIDFALGELVQMLGSDVRKYFVKGILTGWAHNSLTKGAYAAAKPGHHNARDTLAQPIDDRLFFAGEAMAGGLITLCGGAFLSGVSTAKKVIKAII